MLDRRQFLASPPAAAVIHALRGRAPTTRAADRKFIFVLAPGGWDPTRALADTFHVRAGSREPGAERAQVGDLRYVDHPDRPSVRAFFEAHASRCTVLEGVQVRTIAHGACPLPHLALGGRNAPRSPGRPFAAQAEVAVSALSRGVSRCATLVSDAGATGWDTHAHNDAQQSPLWEQLFAGLGHVVAMLARTPGRAAPTLAEETLVVVTSEMGRAPWLNALRGKDHWPYTSTLLVGDGIRGGRNVGGWDGHGYGRALDPASAEVATRGPTLSAEAVSATLLALADVDPGDFAAGAAPIAGIMA